MRPLAEWEASDFEALIGQEEGQTLEFKRSDALTNKKWREEIAKDVSAMANAVGGVIVYGIAEDRTSGQAIALDDGISADLVSIDTIHQVLNSGILPTLQGVFIRRFLLGPDRFGYAVQVPAAGNNAPHQAREQRRYFQRVGREVLPLLDFQIRDIMGRRSSPELMVKFSFGDTGNGPPSKFLMVYLFNLSDEPALYYAYDFYLDRHLNRLGPAPEGPIVVLTDPSGGEHHCDRYAGQCGVPEHHPIYKERPALLLTAMTRFESGKLYALGYNIACPGFASRQTGYVSLIDGYAHVVMDGSHFRLPAFESGVTIGQGAIR